MANNRRIFYAIEQVGIAANGSTVYTEVHGAQSAGITTTFELVQVFEIGQLAIYDNIEGVPNIEMTIEKVLDGYPLIYHLATVGAPAGTLVGRSAQLADIALSVFPDTQSSASGAPIAQVSLSGMFVSALSYTFSVDGECRESVTLVGNNKTWTDPSGGLNGPITFSGAFLTNADLPISSGNHVQTRRHVIFTLPTGTSSTLDINGQVVALATILPANIYGISPSGTNPQDGTGAHIQSITISADLGRDQIFELGHNIPYFRYVTFPIEVTTEIVVIGIKWDAISATEAGGQNGAPIGYNLNTNSIRVATEDGTFISLGTQNKLNSVGYTGGDATTGGGNVSLTYRYVTYNDLYVKHPADPTFGGVQTPI
jgi:hypothetical protein